MYMLIVNEYTLKAARKSYKMLEPYEGKLSRTVLRGEGGSNTADSLDYPYGDDEEDYLADMDIEADITEENGMEENEGNDDAN